jgi:menaquinone-9 beta-reductase
MTLREPYDALVVGAGPAGSASAATLARGGRRVLLLEKDRFPRSKVCGEFLSAAALESLDRLDLRRQVLDAAERIESGSVHPASGRAAAFSLPAPGAGLSRRVFDELLARRAVALGAEAVFGARVLRIARERSSFRVRVRTAAGEREIEARAAIGAWGRWDALDRSRGGKLAGGRSRFSAWSVDFAPSESLAGQVRLYLFPGGYCGLSRVEGGRVHLAGVVSERVRRALEPGWPAVVVHARRANRALDVDLSTLSEGTGGFLGAGPVFFSAKPTVDDGVLMAGDAAGVIDPFSGEGQAGALASGILAARAVERGLSGEIPLSSVASAYSEAWQARFSAGFAWSAAFRRLVLAPEAGALAARIGGGRLARFAIARLTAQG